MAQNISNFWLRILWVLVGPEAKELLVIYESEAEKWAAYLHSVFAGLLAEDGISHYDPGAASRHQDCVLQASGCTCKLLILTRGLLEGPLPAAPLLPGPPRPDPQPTTWWCCCAAWTAWRPCWIWCRWTLSGACRSPVNGTPRST